MVELLNRLDVDRKGRLKEILRVIVEKEEVREERTFSSQQ